MRIAVLGAGIVGVATAEWLRRDGHSVTLVDRIEPGDPAQASYGNAGILANAGVVPVPGPGLLAKAPRMLLDPMGPLFLKWSYLPRLLPWLARHLRTGRIEEVRRISAALAALISDTAEQHRALAAGTGAERHIAPGRYVHLYPSKAAWEGDTLGRALRDEAGVASEELDRAALAARDPGLGEHYQWGIEYRDSAHLTDPGAYVAALYAHFRREGGAFLRADVQGVTPRADGVAVAAGGVTLEADHAVLAMGAWSGRVMRALGQDPGLESERGYHLVLEGASRRPGGPYLLTDGKFAVSPMETGLRLAGLAEFAGLEAQPSAQPVRLLRRKIRRVYPDLAWEREQVWMGHRPTTIDSLPVIGPVPGAERILSAYGGQHLGLTQGPRTGRLIADLIAGRTPNIDLAPYRPDRFGRAR